MIKSPLNYIGGKYRLLPQILPLFPENIDNFIDLFAGGLDVAVNVNARHVICNDINNYVIGLYRYIRRSNIERLIGRIHEVIREYGLTKQNREGYNALRSEYNRSHSPLYLFLLVCFGFNHQLRFNSTGEFNNPFGINRSSYNENTEKNLRQLHKAIRDFEYRVGNFRQFDLGFMRPDDFLYADPPYLISCGSYNDGKRGFEGWSQSDDMALFEKLDELNRRGIRFALSNVIRHKGVENGPLIRWAGNYNTHLLNSDYSNSNYQATKSDTVEVLITNY